MVYPCFLFVSIHAMRVCQYMWWRLRHLFSVPLTTSLINIFGSVLCNAVQCNVELTELLADGYSSIRIWVFYRIKFNASLRGIRKFEVISTKGQFDG